MLKVARSVWPCSASRATTSDESTPPDKSTPTGTSATMRRLTEVRSESSSSACQRSSSQSARSGWGAKVGSQYFRSVRRPSGLTVMTVAGGSLRMPL